MNRFDCKKLISLFSTSKILGCRLPSDFTPFDHRLQGETFCKTLPASFECPEEELSIGKTKQIKIVGLSLPSHKLYI